MFHKMHKRVRRTVGPSLATSLYPLTHRRMWPAEVFFKGITMVDVHQNWLKWFNVVIMGEGSMAFLKSIIYLSPFIFVIRISISTVSFLAQPGSGSLCLQNVFLCNKNSAMFRGKRMQEMKSFDIYKIAVLAKYLEQQTDCSRYRRKNCQSRRSPSWMNL